MWPVVRGAGLVENEMAARARFQWRGPGHQEPVLGQGAGRHGEGDGRGERKCRDR